ncbi:MAG: 3'-5' exonuclease, partial [Planctomycetota bacterium]
MKFSQLERLNFDNQFTQNLPADVNPVNSRRQVRNACYSRVLPTKVTDPKLIAWSREVADLLDLDDDPFGFPCLREDDPIIRKYLPPEDSFEHAEERRLFYVAMTRARDHLVVSCHSSKHSSAHAASRLAPSFALSAAEVWRAEQVEPLRLAHE